MEFAWHAKTCKNVTLHPLPFVPAASETMAAAPATSSTGAVAGFLAQWAAAVSGRVGTALVAGAAVLQEVQAATMVGPQRWRP